MRRHVPPCLNGIAAYDRCYCKMFVEQVCAKFSELNKYYVFYISYLFSYFSLFGRPNGSSGGPMFYPWCFIYLFISPHVLRSPSTVKLCRMIGKWVRFRIMQVKKFEGGGGVSRAFTKQLGPNMQNYGRFYTTSDFDREYLRNGAKYRKSERRVIESDSFRIRRKTSGELWSTTENSMWVWSH